MFYVHRCQIDTVTHEATVAILGNGAGMPHLPPSQNDRKMLGLKGIPIKTFGNRQKNQQWKQWTKKLSRKRQDKF